MKTLSRAYQKVLEFYIQKKLAVGKGFDQKLLLQQLDLLEEESFEALFESRHFEGGEATMDELAKTVKELMDVIYVVGGFFVVLGIDPSDFFDVVHEANMRKTGQINPTTGKFEKSDDYECPLDEIRTRLERKLSNGITT